MSSRSKKVAELYSKSDQLFLQLSAYYKKLMHGYRKSSCLTVEQKKIIKLFNHANWQQYMNWVDEKLQENKQANSSEYKIALPQILQQEADLQQSVYIQNNQERSPKCQYLAINNAKLRKENIILKNKISAIQESLFSSHISNK